ncbi:MAG: glycosyltransferase family 4 protein [Candidatus Aenigmatarchaeota archaeon]
MKEVIMFSPQYWWIENKGMIVEGRIENINKGGGLGRVVTEISERLPKYGYHVTVFTEKPGWIYPTDYYKLENITHYKPVPNVDVFSIPPCTHLGGRVTSTCDTLYRNQPTECVKNLDYIFTTLNYIFDFNENLKKKLYDVKNTIIHGHDWFGAQFIYVIKTIRELPDSKTVLSVHMSSDRSEEEIKNDARLQWEQIGCKLADKVHGVSNYQAKLLINAYNLREEKVVCIPNGVDLEVFRPPLHREKIIDEEILKRYGLQPRKYMVFFGRIEKEKGVKELINAYGKVSDKEIGLAIFGLMGGLKYFNDEVMTEYQKLPIEKREKIKIYTHMLPEVEKVAILRNAFLACFPSAKEAFGLVSLEAQACGVPVIVGNAGGLPETIENKKTGILVDIKDLNSVVDGIEFAISNIEMLRENVLENRKNLEKKYSWDRIVEQYIEKLYSL